MQSSIAVCVIARPDPFDSQDQTPSTQTPSTHSKAIRLVCREFILLCKKLNLFADAFVAIDGSKFKAVNNRDRNFTKAKMQRRLQQIDESIERYLSQIARADRQEATMAKDKIHRLEDKITALKTEMKRLKGPRKNNFPFLGRSQGIVPLR